nr:PREDICTED: uncharacterized protein LOC109034084 [Bemisia tabaci]
MNQRKESVKTDFLILGDEAPQYVTKLSKDRMSTLWTHQYKETLYPFSQVLRLRVLQIVCGILVVIMGCVACIEERGDLTNLGFGIPAGLSTVIAAGASIHTSRGFGGYRPPSGYDALSSLRFLGPTIQIAAPLTCLWLTAFSMNILLLVQSILTVKQPK